MLPPGPRVIFIMPKLSLRPILLIFGSLWMDTGDALSFYPIWVFGQQSKSCKSETY